MDYGRAIRLARTARGLRQADLAHEISRDASLVSLVESGKREPNESMILDVCEALALPRRLLDVLASESDDLAGLPEPDVTALGRDLLNLLVEPIEG